MFSDQYEEIYDKIIADLKEKHKKEISELTQANLKQAKEIEILRDKIKTVFHDKDTNYHEFSNGYVFTDKFIENLESSIKSALEDIK